MVTTVIAVVWSKKKSTAIAKLQIVIAPNPANIMVLRPNWEKRAIDSTGEDHIAKVRITVIWLFE